MGVHRRTNGEERACAVLFPGPPSRSPGGQPGAGPAGRVVDAAGRRPAHQARGQPLRPLRGGRSSIPTPPPPPAPPPPAPRRPPPPPPGVARCRRPRCRAPAAATTSTPPTSASTRSAPTRATPPSSAAARARTRPRVAVNPKNPRHLLAGQNDYRRGDGGCGADWSYDRGRHWGSELAPLSFTAPGFTQARHYWDASGDPSVAFDSSGEAYLFCLAFNRAPPASDVESFASALVLFRSGNGGASWSFPASVVKQDEGTGAIGLLDKPYMAVDTSARRARFRDRIYVAWAEFSADFSADADRLRLVRRPRRELEPGPRHQRHLADAVPGQLQRRPARDLRRQPVPPAVHRPQRRPVRGLPEASTTPSPATTTAARS